MARDPDLDLLKAIRLLAFDAVKNRNSDYIVRHIQRWYSEKYHVPLPDMDTIPLEDLLETYFEVRYEDMDDHDREEEMEALIETRPERLAREEKERLDAAEDEEFLREAKAEATAARQKLGPIKLPGQGGDDDDDLGDVPETIPVPVMGSGLPSTFKEVVDKADPKIKRNEAGIKMSFVDKNELDDLNEWDIFGKPPEGGHSSK